MPPPLLIADAGEVPYARALAWQDALVARRQAGEGEDVLLLLSHPPVYTAGAHADVEANLTGARPDIPVVRIDRGGDLTYHGPGQVVAYPILRLAQRGAAKAHVTALEQALIETAAASGVTTGRREGYPGVWVDGSPPQKLAAIGVRITRGVSKHGVALNVDPDMADFDGIIPCGITDGGVTSLARLGVVTTPAEVAGILGDRLARALGREPVPTPLTALSLPDGAADTPTRLGRT